MSPPRKPTILVSYAREDEPEDPAEGETKWLSFITEHLRPAQKIGAFDLWIDPLARSEDVWDGEVERKLIACDIFLLLVSNNSVSSAAVVEREIAIIRERQARGERVCFYLLLLTPTPETALNQMRDGNLRPVGGKPFSSFAVEERVQQMLDVVDEIVEIAADLAQTRERRQTHPPLPKSLKTLRSASGAIETADGERAWIEVWLNEQSDDDLIAIASRAALRAAPLMVRSKQRGSGGKQALPFHVLTSALFRASALTRVALKYPARAGELNAAAQAAAARAAAARAAVDATVRSAPVLGTLALALAAARAAAVRASPFASQEAGAFGSVPAILGAVTRFAPFLVAMAASDPNVRKQIRDDALAQQRLGAEGLADWRLFEPNTLPGWAREDWEREWESLKAALPRDEGWDVWIGWYEDRFRGGSRGEAHELVFASVPQELWDEGPAAANGWINKRLSPKFGGLELSGVRKPLLRGRR